jgi:1-acyl-sn-glycerol-3-phosphate acyltransferase
VENRQKMPMEGGVVLVCNHTGGLDYVALGLASPRQIYYMAKVELFQINPLLSAFFRSAGVFPVRRGQRDTHAYYEAVAIVKSGRVLGMFPEGTRNRGTALQRGKSGAVRIAMEAGAPIVPAGVVGAYEVLGRFYRQWRRPEMILRFGDPFIPEGDVNDPDAVYRNVDRMMFSIAALLPPSMRGLYATERAGSAT